jgi:hypothetical protein
MSSSPNHPNSPDLRHYGRGVNKTMLFFVLVALALIALPLYNLLFLSTSPAPYKTPTPLRPTTLPRTPAAPAEGASPTAVPADGGWCTDFGGIWERFSRFIEICSFPPFQNSSSSSNNNLR